VIQGHAHHWYIESPNGTPTVQGTCECGASRAFCAYEGDNYHGIVLAPSAWAPTKPRKAKPARWEIA
jgi:hypothetical protein